MTDPEPQTIRTLFIRGQVLIDHVNKEISVDGVTYAWPPFGEPQMGNVNVAGWPLPVPIIVNVGAPLPKGPERIDRTLGFVATATDDLTQPVDKEAR